MPAGDPRHRTTARARLVALAVVGLAVVPGCGGGLEAARDDAYDQALADWSAVVDALEAEAGGPADERVATADAVLAARNPSGSGTFRGPDVDLGREVATWWRWYDVARPVGGGWTEVAYVRLCVRLEVDLAVPRRTAVHDTDCTGVAADLPDRFVEVDLPPAGTERTEEES